MSAVLQIGAGGVGRVVAHKLAQNRHLFKKVVLASRTLSKCQAIANSIKARGLGEIVCEQVDADSVQEVVALIEKHQPKVVLNIALPYQDLTIMQACLQTKTNYLDTANYEHPNLAKFEYKEQWAFDKAYKDAQIFALLGSGFDPGVTNVFCAYAQKHHFDEIYNIDILDCNAGTHPYPFATNFNPEINLREVSAKGRYYENGAWVETAPLEIKQTWAYPEIGERASYLLYHEELESLVKNIKGLKRIRFFMTFSDDYLNHMRCLANVGMLGIEPVQVPLADGKTGKVVPIQILKQLLPDPASLAGQTTGKTNIGCYIHGTKNKKEKRLYIYNVCDHQKCYEEVGAQAISYTTGVPAVVGAMMICKGIWGGENSKGVFNLEQLDPDPFLEELAKQGLKYEVIER
ncbi:saccharopine dehydrogenase family protein [Helicobacter ailurogastricus]|uniref:Carboxynorspermidine dehydrogenase n=1 Tax=Helicobacter ailurogastricus TaxID=1578720 RepID=A0A0K2X2J6_9HELI|nr:saccharopine dehydrogenase family protein [Helicobacter ailurogastricus]CRF40600.1 Carboxynorspermidine dehydrogenase [Helicobacter ailurogastricus]CRF42254.1 Carboxynorspermidine dehydrogenase [Helicobacter ailurogastricus]CRF44206.1 Carboxynorspermidine dehydrogenase [Helicobacter ailurogastricus]